MKLLLSTSNEDKTHELKSLLEPLGHTVYTLKARGPKAKVPIRIGISAGSYSRNATAGKIGNLIKATSTIEIATSMAILANFVVFDCVFVITYSSLSFS